MDENLTVTGPRFDGENPDEWRANTSHRITLSNNIVAEGLSVATHAEGEHSKGSLIHDNVTEIAVIKNLYANNMARNPVFKAGARGVMMNNVIYNPGRIGMQFSTVYDEWSEELASSGDGLPEEALISVVGNSLHWGPLNSFFGNPIPLFVALDEFAGVPSLEDWHALSVYFEDNRRFDHFGALNSLIPLLTNEQGRSVSQYVTESKPIWHDSLDVISSRDLPSYIVGNAGARPWESDPVDNRILLDWLNLSGALVNFETDVGGFPEFEPTKRGDLWDSDKDGLPDEWERLKGLDVTLADSLERGLRGDGYTNLEVYLHELSSLRVGDEASLVIEIAEDDFVLRWENMPSGGWIESSTNLKEWDTLLAGPSISGLRRITGLNGMTVFYRWVAGN
ncbi:hypothetical protein MLD52_17055 [Puniceicoccaceae bacterium K14]|nr:hypothetical protein [Puniceicoccaceae bacterium K14]